MTRIALFLALPMMPSVLAATQARPPQPQAARPQTQGTQAACTPQQALQAEQRQDWTGAIRLYTCLSQADPRDWRPVASIAGVYGILNRPTDEQQWAQRAIALAPQQPGPYINLGNAQANLKNFSAAQASFQKALDVAPTSPLGAYSLGVLADSQGQTQVAEQWYRRALTIQPQDENASVSLAALLGNTGRVQQAIPLLQKVVANDPQAQDARQMLDDMQHGGPQQPASTSNQPASTLRQAPGQAPIERRQPGR